MTKTDWTSEEVREAAADGIVALTYQIHSMLTAFAERIEADECAVPSCWRYYNSLGEIVSEWIDGVPPDRHFDLCNNDITDQITIERAFTHPPAQVAQETPSSLSEALNVIEHWGRRGNTLNGDDVARFRTLADKIAPTAEPVAMGEAGRFRKKPVVTDAVQWFKNGDHPLDYSKDHDGMHAGEMSVFPGTERKERGWEGDIVRYYRTPDFDGKDLCKHCGQIMHVHGWVDTLEGGHIVCPGDWIITGVKGEHYPCKPDIFAMTYEPATQSHSPDAADSGRVGERAAFEYWVRSWIVQKSDQDEALKRDKWGQYLSEEINLKQAGWDGRAALAAQGQGEAEVPRSMETAPRDGQMLRLLVRFEEHATEDAEEAWTIGANTRGGYADGRDNWQFAGWCWTHDHFTEGKGTPIGWLPMIDSAAPHAPEKD